MLKHCLLKIYNVFLWVEKNKVILRECGRRGLLEFLEQFDTTLRSETLRWVYMLEGGKLFGGQSAERRGQGAEGRAQRVVTLLADTTPNCLDFVVEFRPAFSL